MYLPLLVKENGRTFNIDDNMLLLDIIARELHDLILDVEPLPDGLQGLCVRYHRDAAEDGTPPPLDFGLTAELLSVLRVPAIRGLERLRDKNLTTLCNSLEEALLRGLGHYHDWPIFKFTHSVSLGQYLEVVGEDSISVQAIRDFDNLIDSVIQGAVTECELQELCKWIVHDAFGNQSEDHKQLVSDLRDMLVTKTRLRRAYPQKRRSRRALAKKSRQGITRHDQVLRWAWRHRVCGTLRTCTHRRFRDEDLPTG